MSRRAALLIFGLALVASSAAGPIGKSLLEVGWSVGAVSLLRPAVALVLLLPLVAWTLRGRRRSRIDWRHLVPLGVVGIAGTSFCYYQAVARMPVGTALMLLYLAPVLMLLWRWVRHGERPSAVTALSSGVVICGLVLVVAAMGLANPDLAGVAWGLGGAVCGLVYYVTSDAASGDISPVLLSFIGQCLATSALVVLAVTGLMDFSIGDAWVELGGHRMSALVPVLLTGCVSTAFVSVATLTLVRVLGGRLTSFLSLGELFAALGLAWLLVGETPRLVQYVGCVLIILGVAAIRLDDTGRLRRRPREPATEPFLPPS